MNAGRLREPLAIVLTFLAALALVCAIAAGYLRHVVVNDNQFADRATTALQAPAVRSLVAGKVTDDLVIRHADQLLAARPLIEGIVSGAVGGRAFGDLFRAGVLDLHRAVFDRDEHTVTLTLADVGTVAASALDVVRPSLARQLRAEQRVSLFRRDIGSASVTALRFARHTLLAVWLLSLIALLAAAGAVVLARDRRRAFTGLGVAVGVFGVLLVVAWELARELVADHVAGSQGHAAVVAVWDAFLGDLRIEAWLLAGLGAVVAAASASVLRPVSLDGPLRAAGRWVASEPRRPWTRALRAVALIARRGRVRARSRRRRDAARLRDRGLSHLQRCRDPARARQRPGDPRLRARRRGGDPGPPGRGGDRRLRRGHRRRRRRAGGDGGPERGGARPGALRRQHRAV